MMNRTRLVDRIVERCADGLLAWRKPLLALFVLITLALGYSATQVRLDPGFNKQIPISHAFMRNYLHY